MPSFIESVRCRTWRGLAPLTILTALGCGNDNDPEPVEDDLFNAIQNADRIQIAALVADSESLRADAGGGTPFHDAFMTSDFVDASEEAMGELQDLLSSSDSYMEGPNFCSDRDVALRVTAEDQEIDIVVGLTCSNVTFFDGGTSRFEYMNEPELLRLAEIAHEAVPEIDPNEVAE